MASPFREILVIFLAAATLAFNPARVAYEEDTNKPIQSRRNDAASWPTKRHARLVNKRLIRFLDQDSWRKTRLIRSAVPRELRWPGGILPYEIATNYTTTQVTAIQNGMNEFARVSCIKFIPRTSQVDYIFIRPESDDDECSSEVGRRGGRQIITLGANCFRDSGAILHELMHAVGFDHEHGRADRDQYIEVLFENIIAGAEYNWDIVLPQDSFGLPYDYKSIMHYSNTSAAKPGKESMRPVAAARAYGITLTENRNLNVMDIQKLNIIAECPGFATTSTQAPATTTTQASVSICADQSADCVSLAAGGYCTRSLYQAIMSVRCKRSCGLCPKSGICEDAYSRCASSTGVCTDPFYSLTMRRQMCAKTCGLC